MKNIVIGFMIFMIIFMGVTLNFFMNNRTDQHNQSYNQTKSIFFAGVVEGGKEIYSGSCLIKLRLYETSIDEYDPRDSLDAYLVVIKKTIAEFVGHCDPIHIGDTLIYDGKENRVTIKNKIIVDIYFPKVFNHLWEYDKIKELHDL